jgi:hypothetical protein
MTAASAEALSVLRSAENMQWYVVPLLVFVVYVYIAEIEKKNWSAVLLGISMWAAELTWEMLNALLLHFTQYAPLWSTPGGNSAYVLYAGLNIEIAFFFAVAGLMVIKVLPQDRDLKILGLPNRLLIPIGMGLAAVVVEVLLNRCGLLIWDYTWWGWPNLWLIVVGYCAPWCLLVWCHDHLSMRAKRVAACALPATALFCHILFASVLGWI